MTGKFSKALDSIDKDLKKCVEEVKRGNAALERANRRAEKCEKPRKRRSEGKG